MGASPPFHHTPRHLPPRNVLTAASFLLLPAAAAVAGSPRSRLSGPWTMQDARRLWAAARGPSLSGCAGWRPPRQRTVMPPADRPGWGASGDACRAVRAARALTCHAAAAAAARRALSCRGGQSDPWPRTVRRRPTRTNRRKVERRAGAPSSPPSLASTACAPPPVIPRRCVDLMGSHPLGHLPSAVRRASGAQPVGGWTTAADTPRPPRPLPARAQAAQAAAAPAPPAAGCAGGSLVLRARGGVAKTTMRGRRRQHRVDDGGGHRAAPSLRVTSHLLFPPCSYRPGWPHRMTPWGSTGGGRGGRA